MWGTYEWHITQGSQAIYALEMGRFRVARGGGSYRYDLFRAVHCVPLKEVGACSNNSVPA